METTDNLYVRNGIYYGRFFKNGKLVRVSLQTNDATEARARIDIMVMRENMARFGRVKTDTGEVIYFIHDLDQNMVKVGISRSLDSRVRSLKSNTASEIDLLGSVAGSPELEKVLHRFLAPFHHRREWFRAEPPVLAFLRALIALEASQPSNPILVPAPGTEAQKPPTANGLSY